MQLCVFMSLFNCIVLAYIMRNKTWWWWWYRSDQSIFREYPCDQRTNRQILPKTAPSRGDFDPHVTQSSKPPTASPSVKPIIRHTSVWDIVRPYDHQRGPKHESKGPINIFLFQPLFTIVHQSPVPHCRLVSEHGRCSLRSSSNRTLAVPRTCSSFGDKSFAAAGPRLWNNLPY